MTGLRRKIYILHFSVYTTYSSEDLQRVAYQLTQASLTLVPVESTIIIWSPIWKQSCTCSSYAAVTMSLNNYAQKLNLHNNFPHVYCTYSMSKLSQSPGSIFRNNLSLIWTVFCKRDKVCNWMIARVNLMPNINFF